jgi:hypothetical protein
MRIMKFFSRKPKKPLESERLSMELVRVKAVEHDWNDMSEEQRLHLSYSVAEKEEMYSCRQDLRFIPPVGKNGGVMQSIANELGLSRQYIHQVFYPKNPEKLFSGRAIMQKRAWQLLVKKIREHQLLPKYKKVFETLLVGNSVEVTISVSKFKWIRKKATELMPDLRITESDDTVPTTYTLIPSKLTSVN